MSALVGDTPGKVMVNASRFRAAHEQDWRQLENIVNRIERRGTRALTEDELMALPLLYSAALSSLSVARETSLDRALVTYLEALCARAYFQIYGVPTSFWRQLASFFASGWPMATRSLWRETLAAAVLTFVAALSGFLLVLHDPSFFYSIMPDGMSNGRDPSASAASLRATLYGGGSQKGLAVFATSLFSHNAQIAIFAFALGFAFAIPTALLLLYNGMMLGAFLAVFTSKGLGFEAGGWLFIHGTTEIFATILAGAAGFRIGTAIAFPGRAARTDYAFATGRQASILMGGAVVMLIMAGLLEGIGRQTIQSDVIRYGIGSFMLIGWLTYFYAPWKKHGPTGS
ncbi:stage II sporulation protein M [Sphingomonas sp. ASY06-1R]|uniref:stage II sporulation protein M n=1 Tax=Sphingomonas sp. ASY06-1R TaxID=3445771 RepID=UPI003FA27336